jgi:hypothetical protein
METAETKSCVAYYRVSTQKQGRSGLGLEAQQSAVHDHLDKTNRKLIGELIEIESGKNPDRPKLLEALKLCRLTRSRLIVARLDRLARNVAFVSRLMETGVDFEAVDFPQANRFTVPHSGSRRRIRSASDIRTHQGRTCGSQSPRCEIWQTFPIARTSAWVGKGSTGPNGGKGSTGRRSRAGDHGDSNGRLCLN